MDFTRYGIDPGLLSGGTGLRARAAFHEAMLTHVIEKRENVCARITMGAGREEIFVLPALQWILDGRALSETRKVLLVTPDRPSAEKALRSAAGLGSSSGLTFCAVTDAEASEGGSGSVIEGDPGALFVAGTLEALLSASASGILRLQDYAFLAVDSGERIAELPEQTLSRFAASLLPPWERRTVIVCAKLSPGAKKLARDLAENSAELNIEEVVIRVQGIPQETLHIPSDAKTRFLLGLLERETPASVCVFCNLADTAADLAERLVANGLRAECVSGSVSTSRKRSGPEKGAQRKGLISVATDEGSGSLAAGSFSLVVNYDIPLEPELYVRRLGMLDGAGGRVVNLACDRYVFGLPSIERHIGASLNAVEAAPESWAHIDRSAGAPSVRRPEGQARSRQPGAERGNSSSGSNRRPEFHKDGELGPSIRKSIAEATGGHSSESSVPPRAKEENPRPPSIPDRKESSRPSSGNSAGSPKAKKTAAPTEPRAKSSGSRRPGPQPRPDRPAVNPGPARFRTETAEPANPYEFSMEDRLRNYREKYAQRANPHSARPGGTGTAGTGPVPAQGKQASGDTKRQMPTPVSARADRAATPEKTPTAAVLPEYTSPPAAKPVLPAAESSAPDSQDSRGLFGKIAGLFRKTR